MRWQLLAFLLLSTAATPAVPAAPDGGDGESPPDQAVEVRRVHLPVIIEPRTRKVGRTDRCSPVLPRDLAVTEDGDPVRVTAVDRTTLDVLHVILLDTSASMRRRMAQTKETAIRYLSSLPADEQALVASFDDGLVLQSVPAADRLDLHRAVSHAAIGHNTGLWSTLYYLLRYLDTVAAHKVIILLSDGEDSSSMPQHTVRSVVEMISTLPNLTIFTVGIDLSSRTAASSEAIGGLRAVSESTGGAFYEIPGVNRLESVFGKIRRRLEHKYYVSYVPLPFGEGPKDEPDKFDSRLRRIGLRTRRGVPCRVEFLAQITRLETRSTEPESSPFGRRVAAPAGLDSWLGTCVELARGRNLGARIDAGRPHLADHAPEGSSALYRLEDSDYWVGRVLDISADNGVLYDRRRLRLDGSLRLSLFTRPTIEPRSVVVEVPALQTVLQTLRRPEHVLLHLLRGRGCDPDHPDPGPITDPRWVHGRTFLDIRESLGLALYQSSSDYRTWARERIRELGWLQMRGVLAEYERDGVATEENIEALRRMVENRALNPEPGAPQTFLAEWLGDVPARELALALEIDVVNRLLASQDGAIADSRLLLERWEQFRAWLPPPTHVRVVTPLVPAYDPDRDVIGFYRIVLPRPLDSGSTRNLVPPQPLGVTLARWMLDSPAVAASLPAQARVSSITLRDLGALFASSAEVNWSRGDTSEIEPPAEFHEVRLRLVSATSRDAPHDLIAWFERSLGDRSPRASHREPVCIDLRPSVSPSAAVEDDWARLRDALRAEGVNECPPRRQADDRSETRADADRERSR